MVRPNKELTFQSRCLRGYFVRHEKFAGLLCETTLSDAGSGSRLVFYAEY